MKWVNITTQSTTVPDRINGTFNPTQNIDVMMGAGWRKLVNEDMPTPAPGYELKSWSYGQDPENAEQAVIVPVWWTTEERQAAEAAAEEAWQQAKSPMLKAVENIYVSFLTTEWTTELRSRALIAPDYTITVENTDTNGNMTYLMQLRQLDTDATKPVYNYFAGEFQRFKTTIETMGGIMSKVKVHT